MVVSAVTEARAGLSELIERVQAGEEVVIDKAGKPVAVLRGYGRHSGARLPGSLKGGIGMAPDFEELPEDLAAAFAIE